MPDDITITGGAGPAEAAAIAAVVAAIEAEEKAALAAEKRPVLRSQWVDASRPLHHTTPMSQAEYQKRPGQAALEESSEGHD